MGEASGNLRPSLPWQSADLAVPDETQRTTTSPLWATCQEIKIHGYTSMLRFGEERKIGGREEEERRRGEEAKKVRASSTRHI